MLLNVFVKREWKRSGSQCIELTRISPALSGRRMHCCKSSPEEITSVNRVLAIWSTMPAISWNYIVPLLDLSALQYLCAHTSLRLRNRKFELCHLSDQIIVFVTTISNINNSNRELFSFIIENVLRPYNNSIYFTVQSKLKLEMC